MEGIIDGFDPVCRFGFIQANGEKLFFHYKDCDFPNDHDCGFKPLAHVEFEINRQSIRGPRAIEVRLIDIPVYPDREVSQIEYWDSAVNIGSARRDCLNRCRIKVRRRDVTTLGSLAVGVWIEHSVSKDERGIYASDIEIFQQ